MRIRTVKPEFFTHEGLWDAEQSIDLPLRISFIGLWCVADRSGRFKWEPRRLGVLVAPYSTEDFSLILDALESGGFVVKYRVGSGIFGHIPSFLKHQIINNREKESELPGPEEADEILTRAPRVPHACPTRLSTAQGEGKGRERKGKEGDSSTTSPKSLELSRLHFVDDDFINEIKKLYNPSDVDKAVANCRMWLLTPRGKGKAFTRRRLQTFLRDAEPISNLPALTEKQVALDPLDGIDLETLATYVADQWPQHAGKPADQLPRQVIEDFKTFSK